jgi:ABC-2 type transport system permease protein
MLRQILALIAKELLIFLRTPRGIAAIMVPPVLQLFIFGYAATFDVNNVPIALMNEDQGPYGRELAARFAGSPLFDIVTLPLRISEIRPLIDRGDVVLAVHIGQHFSADLSGGGPADVQVIVDGRPLNTALVAQRDAAAVVAGFNADYIAAAGLPRPTALTVTRAWFNPNLLSPWYVIPGLVAKILLITTLTAAALSLTHERELGTFERLLSAPLTPLQILIGKMIPALVVGLVQGLTLAALAILWFGVPFRGAFIILGASLIAMLVSAIGIGLMISAIARTQPQAIVGTFLFMVPAVMLSGFATPISSMPDWIQMITLVNPIRYFIAITRSLFLRGSGWDFVWPQLWPMLLIGFATLSVSYWMLRRRLD